MSITLQNKAARFISLEGVDGAGKSTHLVWLADWLRAQGVVVHVTREPGGTPLGEKLRDLLLNEAMHLETEALLMFAARREHLAQLIRPALARGEWVLCDRFTDSSFAYQGGGRGLDLCKLASLERWVQEEEGVFLQPDITFLFDVPLEVSQARLNQGRQLDRFEREALDFHARVRAGYLQRAAESQGRMQLINSDQPIDIIRAELVARLESCLA